MTIKPWMLMMPSGLLLLAAHRSTSPLYVPALALWVVTFVVLEIVAPLLGGVP